MRLRTPASLVLVALVASPALSLPGPDPKLRPGANHHLGDRSFVARTGRRPDDRDSERTRMRVHLQYVRAWLAARPATRPDLVDRRARILAYLDDYIAKGTTPDNAHLPWRTPVFIDDAGQICAVGYLIERSVGRALPAQIATAHRYDVLEDIAAAMPEVRTWIEGSGFTLDELASIQPAYAGPSVEGWKTWDLKKHQPADGAWNRLGAHGTFRHRKMEGAWTVTTDDGKVVGSGTLVHGAGAWTSFYPDGKRMATGPYVDNRAHGAWQIFHPSGNLAAEGKFARGARTGAWRFYYDTADRTPIATGSFDRAGAVTGTWQHYDPTGAVFATSRTETPAQFRVDDNVRVDGGLGYLLDLRAAAGAVHHVIHEGTVGQVTQRLDLYSGADERVYVESTFGGELTFDADGHLLVHGDAGWQASDCHWSAARRRLARREQLAPLHGQLYAEARKRAGASGKDFDGSQGAEEDAVKLAPRCDAPVALDAARAARLDAVLATRAQVGVITPAFVRAAVLGDEAEAVPTADEDEYQAAKRAMAGDLGRVLAENMTMYVEWPHIDGRFVALFATMAGRFTQPWYDGDPLDQADGPAAAQ
jgi:hypothetical protein